MITMVLTNQNACDILGLPVGADLNSVSTKYKQLAIKWHPEKHNYSTESEQRFKQVTLAYKRLTSTEFQQDISMSDCLSLFQQKVFNRAATNGTKYDYSDSSDNSDDDDDDDSDDSDDVHTNNLHKKDSSRKNSENGFKDLTEEEKERRKAEKRRAKKKRQRERKRLEKEQKVNGTTKNKKDKKVRSQEKSQMDDSSSEEDTNFDPNSAFFTKVVSKKKKNGVNGEQQPQTVKKDKSQEKKSEDEAEEIVDPKVLRSRQLAIRGNEMAQVDQYTAAIQLFTEAISLDPTDFRFFGNRSYCFDRIEQYEKALRDADRAIKLDKDWPKGYFRKGRALAGLKMFGDAEKAFMQVLKLDKNCDDAVAELLRVRTHQLMDMGFSRSQSEAAIKKHGSVQTALDSLLTGVGDTTVNDLYISDDEDEGFSVHRPAPIPPPTSHPTDVKMDPTNPEGLTALWVGNVLPSVTEKRLNQLFSKFGQVTSVRPLPEKYCAFINFKTKEAAGRAMHQLQGTEVDGQKLLIKFPDNPLTNTTGNLTIRKNITNTGAAKQGRTNRKMVS
ncbi:nucleolin-like isoform X2 [Physella acuta]|uniref:nucleolin-like isoform X2 n=1 Tax=Physella acuta TaxID=109671 RepID=UPI0027DE8BD8|nr:nucleolin-like isoform X2 [Physella acuta]XP_059142547.1 nucleolin-like isoform X2 [Physella acuta]